MPDKVLGTIYCQIIRIFKPDMGLGSIFCQNMLIYVMVLGTIFCQNIQIYDRHGVGHDISSKYADIRQTRCWARYIVRIYRYMTNTVLGTKFFRNMVLGTIYCQNIRIYVKHSVGLDILSDMQIYSR